MANIASLIAPILLASGGLLVAWAFYEFFTIKLVKAKRYQDFERVKHLRRLRRTGTWAVLVLLGVPCWMISIHKFEHRSKTLDSRLAGVEKRIASLESRLDSRLAGVEKRIGSLESRSDSGKGLSHSEDRLNGDEARIATLEQRVPVFESQLRSTEIHDLMTGVIALSAFYFIAGLFAIAGGIYLISRPSSLGRARMAGAAVTLIGAATFSCPLIKEFKLFDKFELAIGRHLPISPLLNLTSEAHRCLVRPFGDGDAHIPPRTNGGVSDLAQRALQCAKQATAGPRGAKLLQITLVGHVDMRELGRRSSRDYGSNFNLAYQRALAVHEIVRPLVEAASAGDSPDSSRARIALLVAGPENVGPKLKDARLADDRSVEIRAVWLSLASSPSANPP